MQHCIQDGIPVFVHCNGGRGRSAVCVICYLIQAHNWSPDEAFEYVKGKRKIAGMKAWCGLHKQWRAVKKFARELKAHSKQVAYAVGGSGNVSGFEEIGGNDEARKVAKNGSSKVAPLQPEIRQEVPA